MPVSPSIVERNDAAMAFAAGAAAAVVLAATLSPLAAVAGGILAALMTLITLIDRRHFLIPDFLSLPAIPLGLAANALLAGPADWADTVLDGLAAAGIASLALYGLREAYVRARKIEGLGLGDVKLAAATGAWAGLEQLAPAILLASVSALLVTLIFGGRHASRNMPIPFGSFLAPATFLVWAWRLFGNL